MSEYQYYEFRAADQPLTPEQMREVRALSSRAEITPNRFSNTYNFGDFRGDPRKLMESVYDAHVYVSNFGTVTFMLRLPRALLSEKTVARYVSAEDEGMDCWTTDEHTILEWQVNEDPRDEWMEGEGWMGRLLPLRDELVRGDYRSLYIGWLSSIWDDSLEDGEEEEEEEDREDPEDDDVPSTRRREPPVPVGLGALTAAQSALVEFLDLDTDLIAAAASASPEVPANANSSEKIAEWVARLPEQEVRSLVGRIVNGEGLRIQTELQSRYHRSRSEAVENSRTKADRSGRTAADLLSMAAQAEQERKRQEREEREQRKQKEAEERDRERRVYLTGLVPRLSDLWATVHALAEEQKATSYDKACTLLIDLRDAYAQAERRPEFDAEFARFQGHNSRRTALVRKLKEIGLTS